MSYPNSANGTFPQDRGSWSAPQNPGVVMGRRGAGPGDGPAYGRARMQAERQMIAQKNQGSFGGGGFADPLERRHQSRNRSVISYKQVVSILGNAVVSL